MDTVNATSEILADAAPQQLLPNRLIVTLCGTLLSMALYEIWFRNSHSYKTLKNMPGPTIYPFVGNAHLVLGLTNPEIMRKALEYLYHYGETIRGSLGNIFFVFLTNPDDMEIILNSEEHLEKSYEYRYFKPWFGDGLLISKGQHWRHHRKMIAPTFHQSILKSFVPTFVEHSKRVVDRLKFRAGRAEFDIHGYMSQTTVEILLTTAMGVRKLPENNESGNYASAVIQMCDVIHKRQLNVMYRFDPIYKLTNLAVKGDQFMSTILSLTKRVIAERKLNFNKDTSGVLDSQFESHRRDKKEIIGLRDDLDDIDESDVGVKRRLAFMDAMVEMSKNPQIEWNEKDIVDEVNTIMFEGHDTTSSGSSFVLCLLGIHQDIQTKVLEEQKFIFGDDMERDVTFADTLKMNYLERVIKETLRLYPPVPVIARKVNKDVKLASGPYTIPKGTTVVLGPFAVHRRPDIYENPEKFDPDNFLPEKVSKRHYYSYIPFSAGPRSCVGRKYAMLMLKVLLTTILRKYHVRCNTKESDFKLQGDIILKLTNGFNIMLEERV